VPAAKYTLCLLLAEMLLAGFTFRTLTRIPETRPVRLLPDYEIKENKVGCRGVQVFYEG